MWDPWNWSYRLVCYHVGAGNRVKVIWKKRKCSAISSTQSDFFFSPSSSEARPKAVLLVSRAILVQPCGQGVS